jgi:hypothetical protein
MHQRTCLLSAGIRFVALAYVDNAKELRLIFKSLVQADGTTLPVVIAANAKRISTARNETDGMAPRADSV